MPVSPPRPRTSRFVVLALATGLLAGAAPAAADRTGPATPEPIHPVVAADAATSEGGVETPAPPDIQPRSAWNTDGACPPAADDVTAPRRLHLHHTHEPVVRAPEEVPDALRKICQGHQRRGFSDIGYHYLVDPFGRVWQGRGPMPDQTGARVATGAHAQGFNDHSIGVALIGDYETTPPTEAAVDAVVELLGWLAWNYDLDTAGTDDATSTGGPATRFPEGHVVRLPTVLGHRDTGKATACPGQHLYARLDEIRQRTGDQAARWAATTPPPAHRTAEVDEEVDQGDTEAAKQSSRLAAAAKERADEAPSRKERLGVPKADVGVGRIHLRRAGSYGLVR